MSPDSDNIFSGELIYNIMPINIAKHASSNKCSDTNFLSDPYNLDKCEKPPDFIRLFLPMNSNKLSKVYIFFSKMKVGIFFNILTTPYDKKTPIIKNFTRIKTVCFFYSHIN